MQRRAFIALLACPALVSPLRVFAQEIEILTLRYRSAEQLLPMLRPFVEPGGALTGQGNQLFLRTTRGNSEQIKQLIARLDQAPRQLLITVRQELDRSSSERSVGADGSVIITSRGGATETRGSGTITGRDGRVTGTSNSAQQIRVIEGGRAYIAMGTAVPMSFRQFVVGPQGVTQVQGTVFYEAVTGFYAQPKVAGEVVTLELSPEQSSITARGIERAQLSTTVQGRLGEWIAVGGADMRSDEQSRGLLSSGQQAQASQRGVWLKVEDVGSGSAR